MRGKIRYSIIKLIILIKIYFHFLILKSITYSKYIINKYKTYMLLHKILYIMYAYVLTLQSVFIMKIHEHFLYYQYINLCKSVIKNYHTTNIRIT